LLTSGKWYPAPSELTEHEPGNDELLTDAAVVIL
jgi:hypothetical protein